MITFLFAFSGAMLGSIFVNYVLNANNPNWEEPIYDESPNKTDSGTTSD